MFRPGNHAPFQEKLFRPAKGDSTVERRVCQTISSQFKNPAHRHRAAQKYGLSSIKTNGGYNVIHSRQNRCISTKTKEIR